MNQGFLTDGAGKSGIRTLTGSPPPHFECGASAVSPLLPIDAKQVAAAESLYRTATRLQRIGLIVDRTALSPAQRHAAFALPCLTANCPAEEESAPERAPIGFAYQNAH